MFINQKAQEISLALIKLAIRVRRRELRQKLEQLAYILIEDAASRDFESMAVSIDILVGMVTFGKAIYEIEPINVKIILQELANLKEAIPQSSFISDDISSVFSKLPAIAESEKATGNYENSELGNPNGNSAENGNGNGISATIRQSAIIEKIRQLGNTAMKDLLAAFTDVSERTLRYDLQRLCSQGIIDRVGNGGPASYYVLRNKTSQDSL